MITKRQKSTRKLNKCRPNGNKTFQLPNEYPANKDSQMSIFQISREQPKEGRQVHMVIKLITALFLWENEQPRKWGQQTELTERLEFFLPPPKIFPRGNRALRWRTTHSPLSLSSSHMPDGVNSVAARWGTDALRGPEIIKTWYSVAYPLVRHILFCFSSWVANSYFCCR